MFDLKLARLGWASVTKLDTVLVVVSGRSSKLGSPDDAVAGVATRRQAAETKSVFAVDVCQHEGEVLSGVMNGGTAR